MFNLIKKGLTYVAGVLGFGSMAYADVAADATAGAAVITTDGGGAISTVGSALIGLAALSLVYRWVKATFF